MRRLPIPALVLPLVSLFAGCVGKTGGEGPQPTAATSTAPSTAMAPATQADAGEHAGCIYAGTDKAQDPSCPHQAGGESAEPQGPATGEGHFGAPFQLASATPLTKAIAAGTANEPVLVSGEVEAVCQKKGCWMVVKDGTQSARVLMKDHAFAVPMDSRGKPVLVEGTLTSRTFDEAQVKHLEQDKGGDPSKVSGTRTEHVLTATGIRIQPQS